MLKSEILEYQFSGKYSNKFGMVLPDILRQVKQISRSAILVVQPESMKLIYKTYTYYFEAKISFEDFSSYNLIEEVIALVNVEDLYKQLTQFRTKKCEFYIKIINDKLMITALKDERKKDIQINLDLDVKLDKIEDEFHIPKDSILINADAYEIKDFLLFSKSYHNDEFNISYDFDNKNVVLLSGTERNEYGAKWEIPAPFFKTNKINRKQTSETYSAYILNDFYIIINSRSKIRSVISFKRYEVIQIKHEFKFDSYFYIIIKPEKLFSDIWKVYWNNFRYYIEENYRDYIRSKWKKLCKKICGFFEDCDKNIPYFYKKINHVGIGDFIDTKAEAKLTVIKNPKAKIGKSKQPSQKYDLFGEPVYDWELEKINKLKRRNKKSIKIDNSIQSKLL